MFLLTIPLTFSGGTATPAPPIGVSPGKNWAPIWAEGVWADGVWAETSQFVSPGKNWAPIWAEGVWADGVWSQSQTFGLRPDTLGGSFNWVPVGGTFAATLADESDATYVEADAASAVFSVTLSDISGPPRRVTEATLKIRSRFVV